MDERPSRFLREKKVGEFTILFVSLLAIMILPELLPDEGRFRWQLPLFLSIVTLSALSTVSRGRKEFFFAAALLVLGLIPEWMSAFGIANVEIGGRILIAVFLVYVSALTLRMVLTSQEVDHEMILAALCVYLMLGLIWGAVYVVLESLSPGSFAIPDAMLADKSNPDQARWGALYYFSFVTITTLGYGDVTPVASLARSLSVVEALVGQIYLVTLIARLVSMETAQRNIMRRQSGD